MHADFKSFGVYVALIVVLIVILSGCTSKNIPIIKAATPAKIDADLVRPAKRPTKRKPADTPLTQVPGQWASDRKGWGDEADRSDIKSCVLCAERKGVVRDKKTGENVCALLRCS